MTAPTEPRSRLHEIVLRANDLAPTTRDRYLRDLNQWIDFAGADPAGWTRKQAAAFYQALLDRRLKPQSANRLMASVAYASRWWAHFEEDEALDFAHVQQAKPKGQKPQLALSEDAAQRLLATCDRSPIGARDFALLVVGLETGMRRISLAGMRLGADLVLDHQAPQHPYPAAHVPLKGKDPAWVPLSDTAIAALGPWLAILGEGGATTGPVFRPLAWQTWGARTALRPQARAISMSAIAKILDDRAHAASLGHINPHLLRHTFVTWRTKQGLQPHQIASITHHDLKLGALGGYMSLRDVGADARNATPPWLAALVAARVRG